MIKMIKKACTVLVASAFVMLGGNSAVLAATLYIDFGVETLLSPAANWNNATAQVAGTVFTDGVDSTGTTTTVGLELITPFSPVRAHANGPIGILGYPDNATIDGWHNNAVVANVMQARIHGLLPGESYDFTFYAGENGANEARKQSVFKIGAQSASLNWAAGNTSTVTISGAVANVNGDIDFFVDNNGSADAFSIINSLQIDGNIPVPEPASMTLIVMGATLTIVACRRRR